DVLQKVNIIVNKNFIPFDKNKGFCSKIENSSSEPLDDQQFPSNDMDKRIRAIKKKVKKNFRWLNTTNCLCFKVCHENLSIHCMQIYVLFELYKKV
ncbi:MAG: hypothetical protein Q8835_02820, partial [Sweet potato little leaf phytoplasma]|nr:hypothetical protein [Sweet potato little leaf phytoplasma]